MPRDLGTLLARMRTEGAFDEIARNPAAQFGIPGAREYLGFTLLPEREVEDNTFREEAVRYRTIIANDGTRYSPVQKKGGELVGSFLVELGESDIGREITAREYDSLLRLVRTGGDMDAIARVIRWSDVTLNRALVEHNEKQNWDAIDTAQVVRRGDNGYEEVVNYANPAGHRRNALGQWSNPNYDPLEQDIIPMANLLKGKGYTINRIITSTEVINILAANPKMQARAGVALVSVAGVVTAVGRRATIEELNNIMRQNRLPEIEVYDLQYRTSTGAGYFKARNTFTMVATTGIDESIDLGDEERLITNVLGYHAVGRPTGQSAPGRVILVQHFTNKPPRVDGEAWQTQLPVILEPEGIGVIGGIS